MSDPTEVQETLDRALPFRESWRSKSVAQMDPNERRLALKDAEEAYRSSKAGYENPPEDWDRDDVIWAYEAYKRAEWRIRDLKAAESHRFDVV